MELPHAHNMVTPRYPHKPPMTPTHNTPVTSLPTLPTQTTNNTHTHPTRYEFTHATPHNTSTPIHQPKLASPGDFPTSDYINTGSDEAVYHVTERRR